MGNVARWAFGTLVFTVLAVVLVVVFFQWSWLRGPLENRLSAITGKQVHIDGQITGTKDWVPHIEFETIRIEEPAFDAAPKGATIDKIAVELDLRQLLHGRLAFPLIEVSRPVLDLLRNGKGVANWDIVQESNGPNDRSSMPLIGKLKIADGKVTYRDATHRTTLTGTIKSIAATGGNGEGAFTLEGNGTYRNAPFTIKLKGGSLDDLRETTKPYDIDATAVVGKTKVMVKGTVTDPFKLTDMNLKLTAEGDNAQDLYPIFGIPAPPTPPYHLAGTLDRDGKAWLFKNFDGTVGKSDLEGSLRFEPKETRIFVAGNMRSKNLNFADLGLLIGASGATSGDRPVSAMQKQLEKKEVASGRVLPDTPLNFDEVRNVDADVTFKGDHIDARSLPLDDLDLHLKLDKGLMTLAPLKVGVAGGLIDANVVLDARKDMVATDYDVKFSKFQIAEFFKAAGVQNGGSGAMNGRIRLHGTGNSVRASLATATGQAGALVDNGRISHLIANLLGLDVAKALGVLIVGDDQIALHCMVADFDVKDGLMTPRTFVLDTDAALTTGKGTVSLKDEHFDLSLHGDPKSPTPVALGGPIDIGGSFKKPDVGLGAEAFVRGGAAVALGVFASPIAAIVAFIDPGDEPGADCANLEHQTTANSAKVPSGTKHITAGGAPKKSGPHRE
ncbi:MAG TPA: AsmA family protein [Alphaproteobacteria bacterium]|nr:AsmA family protein [Alphaproteobacteria bacterium]